MSQVRENPGFSAMITPHTQNIGTLRIDCISIEELAQTFPDFPRSMPNLRSFSFSPSLRLNHDLSTDPFEAFTPALTHLSLEFLPLYPSLLCLRMLTDLTIRNGPFFDIHLDTFLDFLEGNRALERANLDIRLKLPFLQNLRGRDPFTNRLKTLSISSNAAGASALISRIALQRGATLEVSCDGGAKLSDILSVASGVAHLPNLREATFMEYHPDHRTFRLVGPNGTFSFSLANGRGNPFSEFHLLHLTHVRAFHFVRREVVRNPAENPDRPSPNEFLPSSFPALETLAIEREIHTPILFAAIFSNPPTPPSLKIIAFLDCQLDDGFLEALTQYASNRKNTTSAPLHHVVIVNSKGDLPRFASIGALGRHVPVVDVRIGEKLPTDLI